jgi:Domain of unknown function DUF11
MVHGHRFRLLDRPDQLDGDAGLMRASSTLAKLRIGGIAVSVIGVLALPAAAHAEGDVAIAQQPSAKLIEPGGTVTIDIAVTGQGSVSSSEGDVFVSMLSTSGHGQPADNPYQSIKTSQGTCQVTSAEYQSALCSLGAVPPGATVHVVAVIAVRQSMNHLAYVRSEGYQEYPDDNRRNNESAVTVYADTPPSVTGSKKLVLKGLPDGCFSEDFSLLIVAKAPDVKKVTFFALPVDEFGNGNGFTRKAKGSRLRVTVPVSKFVPSLGVKYDFKVKAKFRGRPPLKATVSFERC